MEITEQYLDMLISQASLNEEKAGPKADSVGDKLLFIKKDILDNQIDAKKFQGLTHGFQWSTNWATLEDLMFELSQYKAIVEQIKKMDWSNIHEAVATSNIFYDMEVKNNLARSIEKLQNIMREKNVESLP